MYYTKYTAVMCFTCNSLTLSWLHHVLVQEAKKVYNVSQTVQEGARWWELKGN